MKEKEIIENNILLALFDGYKPTGKTHPFEPSRGATYEREGEMGVQWGEKFRYHASWNALMPIVEKIESAGYIVSFTLNEAAIRNGVDFDITFISEESKIHAVWSACVEFVKHYNKITNDN